MAVAIQQMMSCGPFALGAGSDTQAQTWQRSSILSALLHTPAHVLSCGRGVEALLLAMLDGHHALYKVGARLEDRGMGPLLQPGLTRTSLHD